MFFPLISVYKFPCVFSLYHSIYFSQSLCAQSQNQSYKCISLSFPPNPHLRSARETSIMAGWFNVVRFTCPLCYRSYANKKGLDRHQTFECQFSAPGKRFRCPYCAHTSKRKDNLQAHVFTHMRFEDPRRRSRRRRGAVTLTDIGLEDFE